MATKAGKVHFKDIKRGKTFYLVRADFPIISSMLVGEGEVEQIRRIRVMSRPFWRKLSATPAFNYVDDHCNEGWVNLAEMELNHSSFEVQHNCPYMVVLANKAAMQRFVKTFEQRKPTKAEAARTMTREAMLNAKQRGLS
jgi:hypothetical protein